MGRASRKNWQASGGQQICVETLKHWNIGGAHALQWDPHSIETKEARCTIWGGERGQNGGQMRWKLRDIETSAKDSSDQEGH